MLVACGRAPTPKLPSPTPQATPSPLSPTLPPSATSVKSSAAELVLCLADEPQSLYLYARPEPGRAHILAALYDGPIDSANYGYQPVLLEKLPGVADGEAVVNRVTLVEGDVVVDEIGRVVTLTAGVTLNLLDGQTLTYSGSGPISAPQMVVTFRLKPGLRWSDGQPLTAADSVFSFEVGRSPDSFNLRRALAERTATYRALDETSIEWSGLPGYLDALYFTNFWTPLPRHLYDALTPTQIADDENANHNPLGWGPFVLREWVRGDHLTFERNPNYFRAVEGLPHVDRVTYRVIPDPAQIVEGLRVGRCDAAPESENLLPMAEVLVGADAANELRLHVVSGTVLEHLDFGIASAPDYARGVGNDFFQDGRARQAFAVCLDRERLAAHAVGLSPHQPGEPPAAFLPAAHPLRAPDVPGFTWDPARGRVLLAELGWADSDGDGALDKDGIPLRLTLAGDARREALLGDIQLQLKANCGIEVETRLLTRGELEGDWPDGVIFGRRFDLALFGWNVGAAPPCEVWTTTQIPSDANPGGANDTGYSNPAFDAACRRARTTLDPQHATQSHAEAQRIFAEDLPVLPLFFWPKLAAARAPVQGFVLDPTSPSELWNIEELRRIEP